MLAHLNGQGGGRGGLADTALASNEDPLQGRLVDQVLESWREFTFNHCV